MCLLVRLNRKELGFYRGIRTGCELKLTEVKAPTVCPETKRMTKRILFLSRIRSI